MLDEVITDEVVTNEPAEETEDVGIKQIGEFEFEEIADSEFFINLIICSQNQYGFSKAFELDRDKREALGTMATYIEVGSCDCTEYKERYDGEHVYIYLKGDSDRSVRRKRIQIPKHNKELVRWALKQIGGVFRDEPVEGAPLDLPKIDFNISKVFENVTDEDIDEMISQVNMETFRNILSNRILKDGSLEIGQIAKELTNDVCKQYLRTWAKNKYAWYLALGRKLKIEIPIEFERGEQDWKQEINILSEVFPLYAYIIHDLSWRCFRDNRYDGGRIYDKDKRVKAGMNLTSFFALYNNDELNIEISKLYQNKGQMNLCISIDPVDFLTTSINKSGWRSCHNFYDGEWRQAPMAYMQDSTSAISYAYDKNIDYNEYRFKFTTNSKRWRQMIYWDARSSMVVFSRQYPYSSDNITFKVRELLEAKLSKLYDCPNKWYIYNHVGKLDSCVERAGYVYNDVENEYDHKVILNKCDEKRPRTVMIGVEEYKRIGNSDVTVDDSSGARIW